MFYFEVSGPDAPQAPPNGNSAIAAVLPLAMSLGRDLRFDGEADSDFLSSMEQCAAFWSRWRPDLFHAIKLSATNEAPPFATQSNSAIMAFFGGLDSTFALHAHKLKLLDRRSLDVKAAFLIEGFDILQRGTTFASARTHAEAIAREYGVRMNVVSTDWRKPFSVNWAMMHVMGLTGVLHLFHRQFGTGVFADDFAYDAQWMPWSNNAVTNQMLGAAAFPIRSTGASWSRTEKARVIAATPVALEHLRVCFERPELGRNCGRCEKCIRTRVNFHANGVAEVHALGGRLTPDDLDVLRPLNSESILWYEDALANGTWERRDPIRVVLQSIVDDYVSTASQSRPKVQRGSSRLPALRKRAKVIQKMLRHYLGGGARR